MKCSEVMKRDVLKANSDDSLQKIAMTMLEKQVGFLPVVDDEGRFKGAVTERGLLGQVVATGRSSLHLKAGNVVMPLPTVAPDDEHTVAEQKMREAKARAAAVIDAEDHFFGLITLGALAEKAGSAEAGNLLKELQRAEI